MKVERDPPAAELLAVKEASRRIIERIESGWPIWNQFDEDAVTLAKFVAGLPDMQAAHWRPALVARASA
jgi:hypothetical protein